MLTQAEIKYIRSLHSGHVAKKEGKFVAEGLRMVQELLQAGFLPERLYTCSEAQNEHEILQNAVQIGRQEMGRITNLEAAPTVLAVFPRLYTTMLPLDTGCSIFLESVQDPGNLGTIIRTAAWFGIKQILCSEDTVSLYNSKVLQATMGAVGYIPVVYTSYDELRSHAPDHLQVVATCLDGVPLTSAQFRMPTLLLFGNEGKGLSQRLLTEANLRATIPKGRGGQGESLNVASAVAILCAALQNTQG